MDLGFVCLPPLPSFFQIINLKQSSFDSKWIWSLSSIEKQLKREVIPLVYCNVFWILL